MRKMTALKRVSLLLGVCALLWAFLPSMYGVFAQGTALIHLAPDPALVGAGQTAAVEVRVDNVQDLYGLDIRLRFDPSVVEVVDADEATEGIQVRPGELLHPDLIVRNVADNTEGTIWFALTQLNPSEAVSGSGTAFVILVRGKRAGFGSPLSFTYQKMATRDGKVISASAQDGEVRVVEEAQAPPTPTQAPPPPSPTVVIPTETAAPPPAVPPAAPTAMPTAVPTNTPVAPATQAPVVPTPTAAPTQGPPVATSTQMAILPPTATSAPIARATQPVLPSPSPTSKPQTSGTSGLSIVLLVVGVIVVFAALFLLLRGRAGPAEW